tara:strand:+ start:12 stop:179 length:168 start_codon:yes stop_codon:yes gene_type:complete
MADLNDQYKFVREDELKHALRDILNYCKYDTCVNLQKSVKIVEEYLEGKSIKNEK